MSDCYTFESISYDDGIFNSCVDATYIIHVVNNDRLDHVKAQLSSYHPTNQLFLLHNTIDCDKKIENHIPPTDLVHAFLECFQHAKTNGYGNILILEDDFIFSEDINSSSCIDDIHDFLQKIVNSSPNQPIMYRLGCIPFIQIPSFHLYDSVDFKHWTGMFMGTHAVIYNREYCESILQYYEKNANTIQDWDIFNNTGFANSYTYYKPLCFQLFPPTDNSFWWGFGHPITSFFGKLLFNIFQWLGLDKSVDPGYSFFYGFSKIIALILFGIVMFIIFLFYRFARVNHRRNKKNSSVFL
jgi:hypothetical protein